MRLLLLVLLASSSFHAAAPKRAPLSAVLKGDALAAFEAAKADFKAQKYQQALLGFERAAALSKDARLKWNAAACLRKLERNAEALALLDAYLKEAGEDLAREDIDEAQRSQEALRALVATVVVTVTPGNAKVSIDGTALEVGEGRPHYLQPGRHALVAEAEGFQSAVRQESVVAGAKLQWSLTLQPVEAPKTVIVTPPPPEPPPRTVVTPAPPPPPKPVWIPLAGAAAGAVALAVGAGLMVSANDDFVRFQSTCLTRCDPAQWAGSRDRETLGAALLIGGSVVALAGLTWGAVWLFGGEQKVALQLSPTRIGVEVRW